MSMPDSPPLETDRSLFIAGALLIFLAILLAYIPAIHGSAVWDDDYMLTQNPVMTDPGGLHRIFFDLTAVKVYYPVTQAVLWLECRCFGLHNLTGYHVMNVLFHATNTVLLWRLLMQLRVPRSFFAAMLFGLHPLQVESVAWVTEHKNTLSLLFYLISMRAYLRYRRIIGPQVNSHPGRWYLLALLIFAVALGAKSTVATLPAAAMLMIWWKAGRVRIGDVVSLMPFFGLAIISGQLTQYVETHVTGIWNPAWSLSPAQQFLVAGRALIFYLSKLVCPIHLSFAYHRWTVNPAAAWQYLFPLSVIAVIAILFFARRRIGRGPLVAMLFFAGTLAPALGFFHVLYSRYSFVADHFQYIAGIGPLVLLAVLLHRLASRAVYLLIVTVVLVTLGMTTAFSAARFHSDEEVWHQALTVDPDSPVANVNYASDLIDDGQLVEAQNHLQKALAFNPDGAANWAGLGRIAQIQGRYRQATDFYLRAVQLEPTDPKWRFHLGTMYGLAGNFPAALDQYHIALNSPPDLDYWAQLHENMGICYLNLHPPQFESARREFTEAVRLSPDLQSARRHLAALDAWPR
jgi:tetratricopeptide (TPR) repeat protein